MPEIRCLKMGKSSPCGRRGDRWRRSPYGNCLQRWRFVNFQKIIEFRFLWDIISVNISILILMLSSISENREVWRLSKSFPSCNIHRRRNRGKAEGAAAPPTLKAGRANAPATLAEKCTLKTFRILFLFKRCIFKRKWPKSEEKLKFGGS